MKKTIFKVFTFIVVFVAAFLIFEVAIRIRNNELFTTKNFLLEELTLFKAAYPWQYDSKLGWVPQERTESIQNYWQSTVTIDNKGFRNNGVAASFNDTIFTLGDSFTFGDQVSDNETFSALLENKIGKRVINGGVFNYGLDQIYLRTLNVVDKYKPKELIISIIPEDIIRCSELCRNGLSKPFFELNSGNNLVLKNIPVPVPDKSALKLGAFRTIFGYSLAFHKLFKKKFPIFWYSVVSEKVNQDYESISNLLIRNLRALAEDKKIKITFVVLYTINEPVMNIYILRNTLAGISNSEYFRIVDFYESFEEVRKRDINRYLQLYSGHFTKAGNEFVANKLSFFVK